MRPAFGLGIDCDLPLPGAWRPVSPPPGPVVRLREAEAGEIAERWSGRESVEWEARIDAQPFRVERGLSGDRRFVHGERSVHLLTADSALLLCAAPGDDPLRWRVVLDSVLFSVALLHGCEALHGGAVVGSAGAVAVLAASGGGKSTLLSALLAAGADLLSDDVVALEVGLGGEPVAHSGPPLMTVPVGIEPPPGDPIAVLGEERWCAVPAASAAPLGAIVVLERAPGLETEMRREVDPFVPLLSSLLRYPRTPERERARFELAAALAAKVPIWRLRADLGVAPAQLAELIRLRVLS